MDFGAMFQTWMNVLTKPGEEIFEQERQQPHANLTTALIWIVIAAVIMAIFNAIGALIGGALGMGAGMMESIIDQADLPPEVAAQIAASTAGNMAGGAFGAFCGGLILAPIFFLIGSGIYYVLAKLFSGEGVFEEQTYLLATFTAPLMIVTGVLGIIPALGECVNFFLWIYQLVLTYFAIKVSHGLTSGKAVTVVLVPILVMFLCIACAMGVAFFGIMTAVGSGDFY
jgi:hypothetical protein